MNAPVFDDIGSFPPPAGITRPELEALFKKDRFNERVVDAVSGAMRLKIESGVEIATYPQFRDMHGQFLDTIEDSEKQEAPYLVREEDARIEELDMLEGVGSEYEEKHGCPMPVRVCVTGAIDLYLRAFGSSGYTDLLNNIASSVSRFTKQALQRRPGINVEVISFDEPSLGLSPDISFSTDEIIKALEIQSAAASTHGTLTQIHLHSPLQAPIIYQVEGIDVIGVESAASPGYLELFDRGELEACDKTIRLGIARTDIDALAAEHNKRLGVNLWNDPQRLAGEVLSGESVDVIYARLRKGWEKFGESISFTGPDCALGSWPSQEAAVGLLKNVRAAIDRFRGEPANFR